MTPHLAAVRGQGIAGLCIARLLAAHGWSVEFPAAVSPGASRRLVLSDQTAALVAGLFGVGTGGVAGLFARCGAVRVQARIVDGGRRPTAVLPHPGFSVASGRLVEALRTRVVADSGAGHSGPAWVVDARGRHPMGDAPARVCLGRRQAITVDVVLREGTPPGCCWMETTAEGWLFLAPTGGGSGCLQAVVPGPTRDPASDLDRLLTAGAVVARRVVGLSGEPVAFDAAPSLAQPVAELGILRVGDAAVSFDPVCGDGTGNAVRSALLAAAVLGAVARGLPCDEALGYYRWRLERALLGHARACDGFYRTEFRSAAWADEMARASAARGALDADDSDRPGFRLDGLRLVRSGERWGGVV